MNIKKKNFIFCLIGMFVFACLLTCGIFAVVTKSVSFNLALKVEPKVFFSMTLAVSTNNGETWSTAHEVFNNKTGENVVNWATVNQNTIVLNQVLAGNNLPEIANGCKLKLTVTNLTEKSVEDAEEYLHLTLNYLPGQVQTFTMDNGYGIVNMEYGTSTATQEMIITASNILADTYIFIPFLAEIDEKRFTATITTDELCNLVYAQPTFTLGEKFTAHFEVPTIVKPYINYVVNVYETTTKEYRYTNHDGKLTLDPSILLGNITIDIETLTEWNGEVLGLNPYATYAGGIGSEGSPYLLSTALELAQLSANTNNGMDYKDTYFKMTNDIYLNDETFEFDKDTGLVNVSNGTDTFYIGTGIPGDATTSTNTTFDETESETGACYASNTSAITATLEDVYPAGLNHWTPINNFAGNFNGNHYTVNGMFINEPDALNLGLVKINLNTSILSFINIANTFLYGSTNVGAILGKNLGVVNNCNNYGIIIAEVGKQYANSAVGGVVGVNGYPDYEKMPIVANCENYGVIKGAGVYVGGIVGLCGDNSKYGVVSNCINHGDIYGYTSYVGGVVGARVTGSIVEDCAHLGNVFVSNVLLPSDIVGGVLVLSKNQGS